MQQTPSFYSSSITVKRSSFRMCWETGYTHTFLILQYTMGVNNISFASPHLAELVFRRNNEKSKVAAMFEPDADIYVPWRFPAPVIHDM